MDRAVCLSTNDTTEPSGYRILAGTDAGWFQNQGPANQLMNLAQQMGGQQLMANAMFLGDRAPQRHVEA